MIEPKELILDGKTYIISKFPAVAGREIITKYLSSGAPKIGNYEVNEATMLKLMAHVTVKSKDNVETKLITRELIDNHISSWEILAKIEVAMMEYNCSFFQNGRISNFLKDIAPNLKSWITKTLTDSLAQLLQTEKQPSTN